MLPILEKIAGAVAVNAVETEDDVRQRMSLVNGKQVEHSVIRVQGNVGRMAR